MHITHGSSLDGIQNIFIQYIPWIVVEFCHRIIIFTTDWMQFLHKHTYTHTLVHLKFPESHIEHIQFLFGVLYPITTAFLFPIPKVYVQAYVYLVECVFFFLLNSLFFLFKNVRLDEMSRKVIQWLWPRD